MTDIPCLLLSLSQPAGVPHHGIVLSFPGRAHQ
jgi:fatty acid desaturase